MLGKEGPNRIGAWDTLQRGTEQQLVMVGLL